MKPAPAFQTIANRGLARYLYTIPSAGATPISLVSLARALPKTRQVRCFRFAGMEDTRDPHGSIAEMASDFIDEMTADDPDGPYTLLGYCFGGTVAFEVAVQLEAAGRPVEMIILIETFTPNFAGSLSGPSAEDGRTALADIYRQATENHKLLPGTTAAKLLKVLESHIEAGIQYRGHPVSTDINIIRTRNHPTCFFVNWPLLSKGVTTEAVIPGTATSILVKPLQNNLVNAIGNVLDS